MIPQDDFVVFDQFEVVLITKESQGIPEYPHRVGRLIANAPLFMLLLIIKLLTQQNILITTLKGQYHKMRMCEIHI